MTSAYQVSGRPVRYIVGSIDAALLVRLGLGEFTGVGQPVAEGSGQVGSSAQFIGNGAPVAGGFKTPLASPIFLGIGEPIVLAHKLSVESTPGTFTGVGEASAINGTTGREGGADFVGIGNPAATGTDGEIFTSGVIEGRGEPVSVGQKATEASGAIVGAGEPLALGEQDGDAEISFVGGDGNIASLSEYTLSGLDFGAATGSRYLLAAISFEGLGSISSVTIGGVTASLVVAASNSGSAVKAAMYMANVPTGTSGDVVVNLSGGNANFCYAHLFRISKISSATPHDTDTDITSAYSKPITIPAGGVAVGLFSGSTTATSATWTNLTERNELDFDSRLTSAACDNFASTQASLTVTVTGSPSPGNTAAFVIASFG
jgi:hypothetical protein